MGREEAALPAIAIARTVTVVDGTAVSGRIHQMSRLARTGESVIDKLFGQSITPFRLGGKQVGDRCDVAGRTGIGADVADEIRSGGDRDIVTEILFLVAMISEVAWEIHPDAMHYLIGRIESLIGGR